MSDGVFLSDSDSPFAARIAGGALRYGAHTVLAPYRLEIRAGEWIAVLGPSGVGKSTLLKSLAGLLAENAAPDLRGRVAWMAQTDLLLPWLSLQDNLCLGQTLRGEADDPERARALLARVGLADQAQAWPAQLSGGMRQRAALARTLMEDRPLVLMDEPFSALDPANRLKLHRLAAELLADRAVLFVTHDPAEALSLADRVYILAGAPAELHLVAELNGTRPRDPLAPKHVEQLRRVQAAMMEAAI